MLEWMTTVNRLLWSPVLILVLLCGGVYCGAADRFAAWRSIGRLRRMPAGGRPGAHPPPARMASPAAGPGGGGN